MATKKGRINMEKDRGFRVLAIVAICIAVAGLTIGYAALSTTLNITTKVSVPGSTWSVKFANLGTPTLTGSAAVVNAATINDTLINIDVSVKQPGDSIVYTFDVTNDGTLDAKLSAAPTISDLTSANASNIKYTLTYADGSAISANDVLNHGETRNLKLTATYDSAATTVSSTDQTFNISAALLYIQK